MRTKSNVLIAVGVLLVIGVAVNYLILNQRGFIQNKNMPVFVGEEIRVERAGEGIRGQEKAIKAEIVPIPQPKVAAPLPIFPPRISYCVLPEYPVSALEQGLEGTTLLSIYIGAAGKPEKVEVKSSSGVAEFDQAATAAVSEWKFNPASQGGAAIASWLELPIRFEVK